MDSKQGRSADTGRKGRGQIMQTVDIRAPWQYVLCLRPEIVMYCCGSSGTTINRFVYCVLQSPLEDDEGHEADHNCCQDGAVDGDEFVVQTLVEPLLRITITGGGGALCRESVWWGSVW